MKKLIGVFGEDKELVSALVNAMSAMGAVEGVIQINAPFNSSIAETLKLDEANLNSEEPFIRPLEIKDHHVRHFFSKLFRGIVAVNKYSGKVLKSPKECHDFFSNAARVEFGPQWMVQHAADLFLASNAYKDGVFAISDLSVSDEPLMKTELRKEFVSIFVTKNKDDAVPANMDVNVALGNGSKSAVKRVTEQLLNQLKSKWKGEHNESNNLKRTIA